MARTLHDLERLSVLAVGYSPTLAVLVSGFWAVLWLIVGAGFWRVRRGTLSAAKILWAAWLSGGALWYTAFSRSEIARDRLGIVWLATGIAFILGELFLRRLKGFLHD
jgi:hypothetical protein